MMLTEDSRLVLVDFGLAARMPVGVRGGTIAYDAPEKLEGLPGGPAADVYSVGLIWYELLTGHHPFDAVGLEATAQGDSEGYTQAHIAARKWPICSKDRLPVDQQNNRIAPASELNADLAEQHPQIELLLNKCLADNIADRFSNARVLLDSIIRYIDHEGAPLFPASDLEVIGLKQKARVSEAPPKPLEKTPEAKLADAAALIVQGKPDQAIAIADGILRAAPRSLPALLAKAKALAGMPGQLKHADAVCAQALELAPRSSGCWRMSARHKANARKRKSFEKRQTALSEPSVQREGLLEDASHTRPD
jgi:hypothetical protein